MDSHGLDWDSLNSAIWADSLIRIQHCLQYLIQVHVPTLGGSWYGISVAVLSIIHHLVGYILLYLQELYSRMVLLVIVLGYWFAFVVLES